MINSLAYATMLAGVLLGSWAGLWAFLRRPVNAGHVVAALALELLLTVQSGIAVVRILAGSPVEEPATFIAYSFGVLAPLALGVYLARIERTRWGAAALCFTGFVVAIMTLRLMQLWRAVPVV